MISVGSRDGKKKVGRGFGDVGGRNNRAMEDTELEEGEACSYQNEEESNIDPDALTYIDEKLQNFLGHFKKDFEGGVSTENLGAKYGGYGSFLTQRSPVWSCSKSQENVQNNPSHKPPTCLSVQGGNYNSLAQSNGPHSRKHGSGSVHSASSDYYKAQSQHNPVRQIAKAPFKHSAEESIAKVEVVDTSLNMNKQRTLKVRIKVGPDNLSEKKNNAIYSGLGLVSPSSSFDDSPMGSEGLSQGFQFPGDESPTQIVQIMTSLPVYGDRLLSPLPEGLARFAEKLLQDNKVDPSFRNSRDSSVLGSNRKTAKVLSVDNGMKSEEKDILSPKYKGSQKSLDDVNLMLKNQADSDTEACEELVSEALKLPLLSNLHCTSGGKGGTLKKNLSALSNTVRREPVMPILSCDGDWNGGQDDAASLAEKVADEKRIDFQTDFPSYPMKDGDSRGEAANSSTNTDTNGFRSKSRKGSTGHNDSQKQNNGKKSISIEQEGMMLPSGGEQLPSREKKKQSHVIVSPATKIPKASTRNVVSGNKDSSVAGNYSCKKGNESFPKKKDLTKARDKYKDFFGDMIEDGDDLMDSPEEPNGRLKTSQIGVRGLLSCENNPGERLHKGSHEQLISKVHPKIATDFTSPFDHVPPYSDSAPAGAPVENWVQCDKCLKWRLLPFGTKVDSFPEKWLCSMLNWLPGMNSCSITEEETTKAVTQLYQPQNRNSLCGSVADVVPAMTAANDLHHIQNHQHIFPGGGKRKHYLKEVPNSKQEVLHSVKNMGSNVAVGSHLENELYFQHLRNSADPVLETNQRKKKSKKKVLDSYSDGGHSENAKLEGQREPSQDYARASKKMKSENEDWMSSCNVGNEMFIPNSSNEVLTNGAQKGHLTNRAHSSSRSSKGHTDDCLQESTKKSKFQAQASPHANCLDTRDFHDSNGDTKKGKLKSSADALSHSILPGKIINENEQAGKKKARISMPKEKASSSNRGNSRTDKKRKATKDHQLGKDVGVISQSLDDHRSLKRDLESAATSSSSKVSGSQKSKSILRELKNSPVESVSSSPFRATNSDRFASGMKNMMEKDGPRDAGILTKDNPKRFADLEDDSGGERSGAMRKDLHGSNCHQSARDLKGTKDGCLVNDKVQIKRSLYTPSGYLSGGQADTSDQHSSDGGLNRSVKSVSNDNANGFLPKQSMKDSSLSKDKNKKLKAESDEGKVKISEPYYESQDQGHSVKDNTGNVKFKYQEKSGVHADRIKKDFGGKKTSSGIMLDENCKDSSLKLMKSMVHEELIVKANSTGNHEKGSISKKNTQTDYDEKRSKRFDEGKDEDMEFLSETEKSGNKGDLSNRFSQPYQGNGADLSCIDAHDSGKDSKDQMPSKKSDVQNGTHSSTSKHKLSNAHKFKDRDAPSPLRKDSHNQAATIALKEATDFKHLADRIKNSGSAESTGLYFEAALKFLHGACLLESSGCENSKRGDTIQSMQVYSSTAKLCEFCALEYEKSKDLASAALAYKCMEVAYLRVIYSSHPAASRDRHELQISLQVVPPGESPSSSASDIDNASNPTTAERVIQARDGNSPQPAGNHVIAARNRPNFTRLLNFMQDVNSAMEASRKSQGAFAAAKAAMRQADSRDRLDSVKSVLDFNFHDVDGLLHLVRLAVEAIKQ